MVVLICTQGLDLEVNMSVPAPRGEKTQNHTEKRNVSVFHSPGQVSVSMWCLLPKYYQKIIIIVWMRFWIKWNLRTGPHKSEPQSAVVALLLDFCCVQ